MKEKSVHLLRKLFGHSSFVFLSFRGRAIPSTAAQGSLLKMFREPHVVSRVKLGWSYTTQILFLLSFLIFLGGEGLGPHLAVLRDPYGKLGSNTSATCKASTLPC